MFSPEIGLLEKARASSSLSEYRENLSKICVAIASLLNDKSDSNSDWKPIQPLDTVAGLLSDIEHSKYGITATSPDEFKVTGSLDYSIPQDAKVFYIVDKEADSLAFEQEFTKKNDIYLARIEVFKDRQGNWSQIIAPFNCTANQGERLVQEIESLLNAHVEKSLDTVPGIASGIDFKSLDNEVDKSYKDYCSSAMTTKLKWLTGALAGGGLIATLYSANPTSENIAMLGLVGLYALYFVVTSKLLNKPTDTNNAIRLQKIAGELSDASINDSEKEKLISQVTPGDYKFLLNAILHPVYQTNRYSVSYFMTSDEAASTFVNLVLASNKLSDAAKSKYFIPPREWAAQKLSEILADDNKTLKQENKEHIAKVAAKLRSS